MSEEAEARCSARSELCMWVGPASGLSRHEMSCPNQILRSELRSLLDRIAALESEMRAVNPSSHVLATPLTLKTHDGYLVTITSGPPASQPAPQSAPASQRSPQPVARAPPISQLEESEEVSFSLPVRPSSAPAPPRAPPAPVSRSVPNVGEKASETRFTALSQQSEPVPARAPAMNAADLSRAFAALKPVEEEAPTPTAVGDAPVHHGSAHSSELEQKVNAHRSQHENVAAEDPTVQAERMRKLRERQDNEESDFRRRREEAEREKKATLDAMRVADDERRKRLVASAPANSSSATSSAPHYSGTQHSSNFAVPTQSAQTGSKCGGCSQVIPNNESFMKANNKKWHPDCLRCAMCRGSLERGFRAKGQKLYCDQCWSKA